MGATSHLRRPIAWAPTHAAIEVPTPTGVRVFRISLALFIAVAVARTQDVVSGLAHLRPGKLLAIPLLLALIAALPRWQLFSVLRTTTARCIGVIALLSLLSIPFSLWPSHSALSFVNTIVPSAALFVACATGFADRHTARLCILALTLAVAADALYLLAGLAPEKGGRPYIGGMLDPNDSAALFVATIPFCALLATGGHAKRWVAIAVVMLLVAALVKTGSRGGLVGLLVVAVTMVLQAKSKRRFAYMLAVAAGTVVFSLSADDALLTRFKSVFAPTADYNFTEREGRVEVWKRGLGYMFTHPILGVGLNNFETAEGLLSGKTGRAFGGVAYTASHNAFVQIGAELGVIGLATFVIAIWSAGRGCRRVQRIASTNQTLHPQTASSEAKLAAAAYSALLGTTTTALFLSLAYHPLMHFVLAVSVGVAAGSYFKRSTTPAKSPSHRAISPALEVNASGTAVRSR